jgi:hypothetical protein
MDEKPLEYVGVSSLDDVLSDKPPVPLPKTMEGRMEVELNKQELKPAEIDSIRSKIPKHFLGVLLSPQDDAKTTRMKLSSVGVKSKDIPEKLHGKIPSSLDPQQIQEAVSQQRVLFALGTLHRSLIEMFAHCKKLLAADKPHGAWEYISASKTELDLHIREVVRTLYPNSEELLTGVEGMGLCEAVVDVEEERDFESSLLDTQEQVLDNVFENIEEVEN